MSTIVISPEIKIVPVEINDYSEMCGVANEMKEFNEALLKAKSKIEDIEGDNVMALIKEYLKKTFETINMEKLPELKTVTYYRMIVYFMSDEIRISIRKSDCEELNICYNKKTKEIVENVQKYTSKHNRVAFLADNWNSGLCIKKNINSACETILQRIATEDDVAIKDSNERIASLKNFHI